jgi:hypothetical protein
MRRRTPTLALLLLAAFTACKDGGGSYRGTDAAQESPVASSDASAPPAMTASEGGAAVLNRAAQGANPAVPLPNTSAADTAGAPVIPQMIIREGKATLKVDSLEPAVAAVKQLATRLGGYVASSTVSTGPSNVRQATLELKLPAARWDQALSGLSPIGKLESQQESSEDVGEEFVDVSARTANARRMEERLVTLLATRTGRLEDVLLVERELARVREEIERYDGRLRYLRARTSLSTLTVEVHEPVPTLAPGGNRIVDAAREAWDNFVGFTAGFIALLGWLLPLLAILAGVVWGWRRLRRGRGSLWPRRERPAPPPPPAG